MRDPRRIGKFAEKIAAAWRYVPDMRFGQLMLIIFKALKRDNVDPFEIEDDEMIAFIQKYCREHAPYRY